MKRGTNVGQAYVSITADGSGINDEIVDEFDKVDYKKLGNAHGKEYTEAITDRLNSLNVEAKKAFKSMGKAIDTDNALAQGVRRQLAEAFDKGELDSLAVEVGRRVGVEFGEGFDKEINVAVLDAVEKAMHKASRSGSVDLRSLVTGDDKMPMLGGGIDEAVKNLQASIDKQRKEEAAYTKYLQSEEAKRLADFQKSSELRVRQEQHEMNERLKARKQYESEIAALLDAREDDEKFAEFTAKAQRELDKLKFRLRLSPAEVKDVQRRLRDSFEQEGALQIQLEGNLSERERDRIEGELAKVRAKIKVDLDAKSLNRSMAGVSGNRGIGDRIGAMLGAGSRNNALNLLGSSVGNITNGVFKLGRVGGNVFRSLRTGGKVLTDSFKVGFLNAAEGATELQKVLSGISSMTKTAGAGIARGLSTAMASIAASGPAVVAAGALLVGVLSVLVSVMGALLGIVVALSSTIVSGLAGAFIVLAATMLPVVTAAGLITAAFVSMTDAQKKALSTTFEPVKKDLADLGQAIYTQFTKPMFDGKNATQVWAQNFQNSIALIMPFADKFGAAFARAGNTFTAAFSGPGFQRLALSLGTFLPSIITRLTLAFSGFANGFAGMFAALMPTVNRFAGYLSDVAARFSTWANSAKGQNAIVDFTNRAVESLKSLWGFTKQFFGFLSDILFSSAAQTAGNTIFDDLSKAFSDMRKNIKKEDLKKWLTDAVKFGRDLGKALGAAWDTAVALYNSNALQATGAVIREIAAAVKLANKFIGPLVDLLGLTLRAMQNAIAPAGGVEHALSAIGDAAQWVGDKVQWLIDKISGLRNINVGSIVSGIRSSVASGVKDIANPLNWFRSGSSAGAQSVGEGASVTAQGMATSGRVAAITSAAAAPIAAATKLVIPHVNDRVAAAPRISKPRKSRKGENVYSQWAKGLIDNGPSVRAEIKAAIVSMNKSIAAALSEAGKGTDLAGVREGLKSTVADIKDTGVSVVETAQQALNNAAASLASASGKKAVARAMKQVRAAQKTLQDAQKRQKQLDKVAKILNAQQVVNEKNVTALLNGGKVANATLADYALARERLAVKIEAANAQLAEAIQLRDDYKNSVADSIKSFGSLLSAQGQTINGVEQALTANDITGNLRSRLAEIQKFQDNLRILRAQGLSDAAYKQLVDAGVEQGGAFAEALIAGGAGTVEDTNNLVAQIGSIAESLGTETSSALYQAGVDAAQGLLDGLTALDKELEAAATALGNAIAAAVKKALGIKSPSTVMIGAMDHVGDGTVIGLDNQTTKVDAAAARLAGRIAVSPEVAAYAATQRQSPYVSGNGGNDIDITVITPTEDPEAVAREVLNEVTGRL